MTRSHLSLFGPRIRLALTVCCLVTTTPVLAAKPTTADVERLIKKGTELRKQGQDQQALPLFQQAYEIARTGRTAAQLGLCEMQLGYFLPSSDHVGEALSAKSDPWVEKYRAILEQTLHQVNGHIAEMIVTGSPAGAEVSIDDRVVGHLPLSAPVRVVEGAAKKVEARANGFVDGTETVDVHGGAQVRVALHLARMASERPQASAASPAATVFGASPKKSSESQSSWTAAQVSGVVLIGAGIAAVVAGVLSLKGADASCGAPVDAVCNQGARSKVPGWSLIGGGAAAGVVGGILMFTAGGTNVAIAPAPRSIFISMRAPL